MFVGQDIASGQVTNYQIHVAGLPDSDLHKPDTRLYVEPCRASPSGRSSSLANRHNTGRQVQAPGLELLHQQIDHHDGSFDATHSMFSAGGN
jgi:hypothetical protein